MPLSPSDLQAATDAIKHHQRILIIPHANVDPDGLSSALSCFKIFSALGKDCTVICPDTLPDNLSFLPGFESLDTDIDDGQNFIITLDCSHGVEVDKLRYTVEDHKVNIIVVPKKGRLKKEHVWMHEGGGGYDLIVVVDTADLSLLGSAYLDHVDLFSHVPILNIDHHISNTAFGQLTLIDPLCASATEVLYHWFCSEQDWKSLMTPDIATLLLAGLITDTRSFQNPNTTPRSLEVAAELLDLGARQQEIIKNVYKTKPLSTLKIWGRALNHIQIDADSRIVWSSVSREDLSEMGATSKETHGLLDELISTVPDADVHVLFTEVEEGGCKASMRSTPVIDVNRIAGRLYGGGGHARASGFRIRSYPNFQLQVVECIQKIRDEMRIQREEADAPLQTTAPLAQQPVIASAAPEDVQTLPPAADSTPDTTVDIIEQISPPDAPADTATIDVAQTLGAV